MATHFTAVRTPETDVAMALPDQIKNLREEHSWSQTDLVTRADGDVGHISRSEIGKITPSVEVIICIAEIFTDYLLPNNAPRRAPVDPLLGRLRGLDILTNTDRTALLHIIDNLLANTRIPAALHNAG
ncbi:MAG: hypothetical protein QG622_3598 [Actinomycetota bacterium]|nr:hypothetical protein [Actinomycetota bacterium]